MAHLMVSYGAGVESTAILVLASQGKFPHFTDFVFANVGHDTEAPSTLAYLGDVAIPFARENGLRIHTVCRRDKEGRRESIVGRMRKSDFIRLPMPVRGSRTGAPGKRVCTQEFKVAPLAQWAWDQGARPDNQMTTIIGIAADEWTRAKSGTDTKHPHMNLWCPLIAMRLTRPDCIEIIEDAGLPVPQKSACWGCPFHAVGHWHDLYLKKHPDLEEAIEFEEEMNAVRATRGKAPLYLSSRKMPLREACKFPSKRPEKKKHCSPWACEEDAVARVAK